MNKREIRSSLLAGHGLAFAEESVFVVHALYDGEDAPQAVAVVKTEEEFRLFEQAFRQDPESSAGLIDIRALNFSVISKV